MAAGLELTLMPTFTPLCYQHSLLPTQPEHRKRAQFSVNQLVKLQLPFGGEEFSDPRDFGGWGYGATADGAHFNWVVYALYAAKQWGLEVPSETWEARRGVDP